MAAPARKRGGRGNKAYWSGSAKGGLSFSPSPTGSCNWGDVGADWQPPGLLAEGWPPLFSFFASGSQCTMSVCDLHVSGIFPWRERELHPQFSQAPAICGTAPISSKISLKGVLMLGLPCRWRGTAGWGSSPAVQVVKVTRCSRLLPPHCSVRWSQLLLPAPVCSSCSPFRGALQKVPPLSLPLSAP